MCGRFFLDTFPTAMQRQFNVPAPNDWRARYNLAPTQPILMLAQAVQQPQVLALHFARWGLIPSWAKDASIASSTINARKETLTEKPSFRAAFKARRCVIPASGYFEWAAHVSSLDLSGVGKVGQKQPFVIRAELDATLYFAGLWELWCPPNAASDAHWLTTTIVTEPANDDTKALHERMPVMLDLAQAERWIRGSVQDAQLVLQKPNTPRLNFYAVDTKVGSVKHDEPGLIARQALQTTLGLWVDY